MNKHYHPTRSGDGTWEFTTPTSRRGGFDSRFDALKASATAEREDRFEAENGKGAIAKVLRKHFHPEERQNTAGRNLRILDLQPCKDV